MTIIIPVSAQEPTPANNVTLQDAPAPVAQAPKPEPKSEPRPEPKLEVKPDIEFNLDVNSKTIPLPKIFSPNIDLSGRGSSKDLAWPQNTADQGLIDTLRRDTGLRATYRIQWDLWQAESLDAANRENLFKNYEKVFKEITDSGGMIILNLYGTPNGMGDLPDKRSPVRDLGRWRVLVRELIRRLSCEKKYNIWYELWDAPDLERFFLGTKEEYFKLYKITALTVRELEKRYRINIPFGGPSSSWWFQNFDGNTIVNPEKSLIYELIKFSGQNKLPLDFISWHAFAQDPQTEGSLTTYNKKATELIREWLTYFHLDPKTVLIVDEWNFDAGKNISEERADKANIASSYILSRLNNMYLSGIDNQVYFSLQDFQNNKEGVMRNLGAFSYKGEAKSIYNILLMLNMLGANLFLSPAPDNEFVGALATKGLDGSVVLLIWNYIDPQLALDYLSRNIATLSDKGRKDLVDIFNAGKIEGILNNEISLAGISTVDKLIALLKNSIELNARAKEALVKSPTIRVNIYNLKGRYLYRRFNVDSACQKECGFSPFEKKELDIQDIYQEMQVVNPYSVSLIVLEKVAGADPQAKP